MVYNFSNVVSYKGIVQQFLIAKNTQKLTMLLLRIYFTIDMDTLFHNVRSFKCYKRILILNNFVTSF